MNKILLICFLNIFIFSCQETPPKDDFRKVFRYNESKGISILDPAFARNEILIRPISQIFNGLLEMDDSLHLKGCIAKSWKESADGLTLTFILRNDVFFHNHPVFREGKGRKVVASDFVFSFSRILNSKVASPGAWVFNNVEKTGNSCLFKALNDTILQIQLKEKSAIFPSLLTTPYCYVVPKEIVDYYGNDFGHHPVGSGPFMFKVWRDGEKLVLVKNPVYFEKDSTGQKLPYIDAISITFIADKQSEFLEFVKGNIDFLSGVQTAYRNELLTRSGKLSSKYSRKFYMDVKPYLNTEYLGCLIDSLKMPNNPLLNINIRKAINYGFDRAKMLKYLRNCIGTPAYWGIIPKGMPGYSEEGESYKYNPDLAAKLLTQAGFPGGKGLPEIILTTTSDYLDLCEFLQFELSKLGLKIKIEVCNNGATFRELVSNSKLQFFRLSWIADYPDAENFLSLFCSRNFSPKGPNYTHFRNAEYDSLYKKSLSESNEKLRVNMYKQMNSMICNESAIIPLYYDVAIRFYPKNIEGFHGNTLNTLKLKFIKIN